MPPRKKAAAAKPKPKPADEPVVTDVAADDEPTPDMKAGFTGKVASALRGPNTADLNPAFHDPT